jgi:hypothetical protein
MNNWFSHAHLTHLQQRLRDENTKPGLLMCPIDDVCPNGVDRINLKDRATSLLFDLVRYDPYDRFTDLSKFKSEFSRWAITHHRGPTTYLAPELQELYALRDEPGGWQQIDPLFTCLTGASLSHVADNLKIYHHPDDPGLHGKECFAVTLKVTGHDLTNNFSVMPWMAMASRLDLTLPFIEKIVKTQGMHHLNLKFMGSKSDNLSYSDRVARAKPSEVIVSIAGKSVIAVPIRRQECGQAFEPDWAQTKFFTKDRATMESVIAIAPLRAANLLKGRLLEDVMGL